MAEERGEVTVVGSFSLDTIERAGGERTEKPGGVVTYAGLTYRKHGLTTHAVFNLAAADAKVPLALTAAGVHVHAGPSLATTAFVNRLDGEERTQKVTALAAPIPAALAAGPIASSRLVHLGPLHPDDIDSALLDLFAGRVEADDLAVALDVQGLVRRIEGGRVRSEVAAVAERFLRAAGYLKGSEREVDLLSRALGLEPKDIARHFAAELVVTAGSRGGTVWLADGSSVGYAAKPVGDAGDPTGAGDVFFAAYLAARVFEASPVASAAGHAAAVAARSVAG